MQIEAIEARLVLGSMLVKSWRPSEAPLPADASGAEIVSRARYELAFLEAHIERRYLKPPLVQRYAAR